MIGGHNEVYFFQHGYLFVTPFVLLFVLLDDCAVVCIIVMQKPCVILTFFK
jgi:hypothetical protein